MTKESKSDVKAQETLKLNESAIANEIAKPSMDERRKRKVRRNLEGKQTLPAYKHKDGKYMYWAVDGDPKSLDRYHDLIDNDTYDPVTYKEVGITHRNGRYIGDDRVEIPIDGQRKQVLLGKPMEHRLEDVETEAAANDKKLYAQLKQDAIRKKELQAETDPRTGQLIPRDLASIAKDHLSEGETLTNFPEK